MPPFDLLPQLSQPNSHFTLWLGTCPRKRQNETNKILKLPQTLFIKIISTLPDVISPLCFYLVKNYYTCYSKGFLMFRSLQTILMFILAPELLVGCCGSSCNTFSFQHLKPL